MRYAFYKFRKSVEHVPVDLDILVDPRRVPGAVSRLVGKGFEITYKPYMPRGFTAIDVNLRTVTVLDGSRIRRFKTRFVEALSKRTRAEEKRHPKRWKYDERVLNRVSGSRKFDKKLSLWTYKRIQTYIHYEALIGELQVFYVDPRNTSKTPPVGEELKLLDYKLAILPNGYTLSKHHVASWNIALRGLKALTGDVGSNGLVDSLNAPTRCKPKKE